MLYVSTFNTFSSIIMGRYETNEVAAIQAQFNLLFVCDCVILFGFIPQRFFDTGQLGCRDR